MRAGAALGWQMRDENVDTMVGTLHLRKHTAVVAIPYSTKSYSIEYRSSVNLNEKDGGSVAIIGHADPRASDAYNIELGMRRAKAVYEALVKKLNPEVRARVRVESSNDPAAPAGSK